MNTKVLCVDDEANVLAGYVRHLRKQVELTTALSGEQGLKLLASEGPFAVLVTDMRMPGMSGVDFLNRARQTVPDTVRIMLTGDCDQQTAIDAVNEGSIFRFLNKPCSPDAMIKALNAGLEQHRLITAEKELLEQTLHGSIKVLTEILSLANPVAFGRAVRVQRLVRKLAAALAVPDMWRLEVAAMLSQVGCVTVPEIVLEKVYGHGDVGEHEQRMFERHPEIGRDLIRKVPRLEAVAEMVAYQEKCFDGQGFPVDDVRGTDIPLGARILKVALDFDKVESRESGKTKAVNWLKDRADRYDPLVVDALEKLVRDDAGQVSRGVKLGELRSGMILLDDIMSTNGIVLVGKGQEISPTLLQRLRNLSWRNAVREPIAVLAAVAC